MLIKDLENYLKESYQGEIKRLLRDALISLKIQGDKKVSTLAVLKDFAARGMKISITELIDLLQDDPMIQNINREEITFNSEIPNPNPNGEHEEITDEETKPTVKKMARRAINRRFKVYKR